MTSSPKFSHINIDQGDAPWMSLDAKVTNSETIHMSPANGFTAGSYLEFLQLFNTHHSITSMDCRATWAGYETPPRNFRMSDFADDLITAIETQHNAPVIGMGHSQGGFVTLLAAIKRPDLFSKVVLIEPASLPFWLVGAIYPFVPKELLFQCFPFMKGSLNRQAIWQSKEDFYTKYRHHNTFKRFTEQSFNNYMNYGLMKKGDNWQLRFTPQWEAHIFSIVEFIWNHLHKINVPTLFIRAQHGNLYSHKQFVKNNKKLHDLVHCTEIQSTHHLLPLENPIETSKLIKEWLKYNNL